MQGAIFICHGRHFAEIGIAYIDLRQTSNSFPIAVITKLKDLCQRMYNWVYEDEIKHRAFGFAL